MKNLDHVWGDATVKLELMSLSGIHFRELDMRVVFPQYVIYHRVFSFNLDSEIQKSDQRKKSLR